MAWHRSLVRCGLGVAVLAVAVVAVTPAEPSSANTGCPSDSAPTLVNGSYEIATVAHLQWAKNTGAVSNSYKLTADLDMSGCTWLNGIGTSASPYAGTFDGNGKTISNLTINGGSTQGLGLVDFLTGSINDITLSSPTVTGTSNYVGSLVGEVRAGGSVTNATLASVSVTGGQFSGGGIGRVVSGGTVTTLSISGTMSAPSGVGGGAFGTVAGTVVGVTSSVTVTGDYNLGGLSGTLSSGGSISVASATGNVSGSSSIGGAVGFTSGSSPNCGALTNVTTSGNVNGSSEVGGLIGDTNCYQVIRSSSSSTVVGTSNRVGGLVGYENTAGSITGSYFTGSVQGTEQVGGLVGASRSTITDSYSTGAVTATSATNGGRAGGLVGWLLSGAVISRVYAAGLVTPPAGGSSTTGGLIGNYGSGTITASVWDRETTGRTTSGGTGAVGYTTQQMRSFVLYNADNLNWTITDGVSSGDGVSTGTTWSICSGANSGYPFLTRQGLSGTCRPTVAYNGNTNTGGSAPSDASTPYVAGSTVTVLGNTGSLTKTSRTFAGWNTKADGTGTAYSQGETFTIAASTMLFAVWSLTPVVSYRSNGGTGSVANTSGASGASVTLSSGSGFTRSGYLLARWDTSSLGTGTSYAKSEVVTMPAGGLVLYAIWEVDPSATTTTTTTTTTSTTTTTPVTTTAVATTTTASTASIPPGSSVEGGGTPTASENVGGATPGGPTPGTVSARPLQTTPSRAGVVTVTTASPTTTTTEPDATIRDVAGVAAGDLGATLGGRPVDVVVVESNGSLVARVGGATVTYSVIAADGLERPLSRGSVIALSVGDRVRIEFAGFADMARGEAWVAPDDIALGETRLAAGRGRIEAAVPQADRQGERRLTASAETVGGEPIVVAYGVEFLAPDTSGPSWSLVFLIILGLAAAGALLVPAARRRRTDSR